MKKSPLVILFLTVFLDLLGFGMILPLLPYYAAEFHANGFEVGALLAVYSFMQLIFSPIWGRLSDRIGRRPILMLSLLGSSVGMLAFGLANTLILLFAARLFSGITAATISIAQAYIADSTTPENRAKGMGIIGAAFGLGFVFGPALGGVFAGISHAMPAYVAAGLALFNFLFAALRLPESLPPEKRGQIQPRGFSLARLNRARDIAGMPLLMGLYFFTILAFATMEATFPLLGKDFFGLSAKQNGYVFAYIGILVVLLQGGLVGRLAKRYGERVLIIAGALLLAIGLASMPLAPNVGMLLVALAPLAIGNGLCNPSLTSLISRTAEAGAQGEALGVGQSLASLGRILGPLWGGFAYTAFGPKLAYASAGAIMLVLAFFAFQIRRPTDAPVAVPSEAPAA